MAEMVKELWASFETGQMFEGDMLRLTQVHVVRMARTVMCGVCIAQTVTCGVHRTDSHVWCASHGQHVWCKPVTRVAPIRHCGVHPLHGQRVVQNGCARCLTRQCPVCCMDPSFRVALPPC